jgi:hypothetical protein
MVACTSLSLPVDSGVEFFWPKRFQVAMIEYMWISQFCSFAKSAWFDPWWKNLFPIPRILRGGGLRPICWCFRPNSVTVLVAGHVSQEYHKSITRCLLLRSRIQGKAVFWRTLAESMCPSVTAQILDRIRFERPDSTSHGRVIDGVPWIHQHLTVESLANFRE